MRYRLLLLVAMSACTPSPPPSTVATPTPTVEASPTLSPSPAAVGPTATPEASPAAGPGPALDARHGWVVALPPALTGVKVRRETDPAALLMVDAFEVAVSPDGRWIAYWTPSGVRRELRLAPATGGTERVLIRLADDEVGNAHAWSTDGTGLAVQVDATRVEGGGIDPPPAYSSIRTVDVLTGTARELVRREATRLTPIGWVRDRGIVAAYTGSPEGGIQVYHRITEAGDARSWPLTEDFCLTGTAMRLDRRGTRVLSVHPVRCFDVQPGASPRVPELRVWPIDDGDAASSTEFPGAWLLDAQFRPGSQEIAVAAVVGGTLQVEIVSGPSRRTLASIDAEGLIGAQYAPIVFRPEGDAVLVVRPARAGSATFRGRLIDLATGGVTEVDLGADAPSASVIVSAR